MCTALRNARDRASSLGYGLLLWDGYRPQRAVERFARWTGQPEDGRKKAQHYPNIERAEMFERGYVARKSGHSRGSTVDLTLYCLGTSELAAMMDAVSHHGAPGITSAEADNRWLLRSVMESCGFAAYDAEWWHYPLKDEPYPDTCFDFVVA